MPLIYLLKYILSLATLVEISTSLVLINSIIALSKRSITRLKSITIGILRIITFWNKLDLLKERVLRVYKSLLLIYNIYIQDTIIRYFIL